MVEFTTDNRGAESSNLSPATSGNLILRKRRGVSMKRRLITAQKKNRQWIWKVVGVPKEATMVRTVFAISGCDYATSHNAVRGYRSFAANIDVVEAPGVLRRKKC